MLVRYSTLKTSSFIFFQNSSETLYVLVVLFLLIVNPTQNAYNGIFSNVNNEFNVTNVRKLNFSMIFLNQFIFAACHKLLALFTSYICKNNDSFMGKCFMVLRPPVPNPDNLLACTAHFNLC